MKQRCGNPNNKQYKDYGGRGISYNPKWVKFKKFYEDMNNGYTRGLTIERIDTNGNYTKENCRWATRKEQNNNKRCNIMLTFKGITKPIPVWAEELRLNFPTIRSRFYRGMSVEKILSDKKFSRWD